MSQPEQRDAAGDLVDALHGIAMYNDKGYAWMGHDAKQIAAQQSQAQAGIDSLLEEIGAAHFPADLLADLRAGLASRDGSGQFAERVEAVLGRGTGRK